jgi:hypothetical protein
MCVCNICRFLGLGRQPHLAPGRQATPVARPHMGERCTAEEPQNRRFFTHGVAVEVTNGYKYVCITVYIYNITILTMVYYFNYGLKKNWDITLAIYPLATRTASVLLLLLLGCIMVSL